MPLPYRLTKSLVQLWCSARAICAEIEQFRPDVIVALYHGVQPLLHTVQATWAESHDAGSPFPPVAATNFGTEKHGRYTPVPKRLNAKYFIGLYESPLDRGHYLAWLTEQEDWLATLQAQVEAVLGAGVTPERIVVLDDMTYEGNSSLSVLGLLHALYPRANLKYTEGFASGWLVEFAYFWLATYHPGIVERMEADWPRQVKASGHSHYERFLRRLTLGTEDVAPESLDWQAIGPGSATLAHISNYLPAERWLELPGWFYRTVEANVRRWTRAGRPPSRFKCPERPEQDVGLKPADLIARELWLRRSVGLAEAAALARISAAEAERVLASFLQPGFVELRQDDPEEVYAMRNEVAILAYGSLQGDPGRELAPLIERREDVLTPFEVEFARSSRSRKGAPTLVPVPDGQGGRVRAQLLVLKPDVDVKTARNLLYRREIHKVGDAELVYYEAVQSRRPGAVLVRDLRDFAGIPVVLYTELKANIPLVRTKKPPEIKAQNLAQLAVESLTTETYAKGTDGIRYLADAITNGIQTPLTLHYRSAILALAGDAPDLDTARLRLAQERGLDGVEGKPLGGTS